MKSFKTVILFLLIFTASFSQENRIFNFNSIKYKPVYPNCKGSLKQLETCFKQNVEISFRENLNLDAIIDKVEKGNYKIIISFVIEKDGHIGEISARSNNLTLEIEAEKALKKLPKIKPGVFMKEIVPVRYSFTFNLNMEMDIELEE